MNNTWHTRSRRRFFLDFHIDDWNDEFLSMYDPEEYAECCFQSGATAATFMANTHSGMLNYPTKLGGKIHHAFEHRDALRDTINALHKRGLDAIVYYVFVYVVDYWDKHPEARTVRADGRAVKQRVGTKDGEPRFATCCINDPGYRRQSLAELAEICDEYDFEGVWPDMTFWPGICVCENCKARYRNEVGKVIPTAVNWFDPDFLLFVHTRQRWLTEFCNEVSDVVRKRKPGMKFAQQSLGVTSDWVGGSSVELADCWDFMSQDLYNDRFGLSFSSKLFYSLSNIKPYERINCWNYPNIHEHVVTRTRDELYQLAYNTMMHDGALTIIDQIDPVGTIHHTNYKTMTSVFDTIKAYEPFLGGELRSDVGLYYSFHSKFDKSWNGRDLTDVSLLFEWQNGGMHSSMADMAEDAHMRTTAEAAKTLTLHHVPYGVVTKKNLRELNSYRVVILSNVVMMDEEEMQALREYVYDGGCLYASKETATITDSGVHTGECYLSDVFGVDYIGLTESDYTYVSPTDEGRNEFPNAFSAKYPVTVPDSQMRVRLNDNADVLGTLTLPYHYPSIDRYASILTTPPGKYTELPAVIEHRYGKGHVIYSSAVLENGGHATQREVFARLIRRLSPSFCTEVVGYPTVEVTRFEQENRTMIHIINSQSELPNIPIYNMELKAKMNERLPRSVTEVPGNTPVEYRMDGNTLIVTVPCLKDYVLLQVVYE